MGLEACPCDQRLTVSGVTPAIKATMELPRQSLKADTTDAQNQRQGVLGLAAPWSWRRLHLLACDADLALFYIAENPEMLNRLD